MEDVPRRHILDGMDLLHVSVVPEEEAFEGCTFETVSKEAE